MKNTTNFFTKIIIGLFYEECNTQQGQKENEHNYMMGDGHTEIMEGDDHIGDDLQHVAPSSFTQGSWRVSELR